MFINKLGNQGNSDMADHNDQHCNPTAEDLIQVCHRLDDEIDPLGTQAAALVNASRNDLRYCVACTYLKATFCSRFRGVNLVSNSCYGIS